MLVAFYRDEFYLMRNVNFTWLQLIKSNFAGGSPAASNFLLLRQKESNQRKGDPGLPPLRGSLDQPQASGAAQLDLTGRTPRAPLRDSNSARLNLRFLAADRGGAQGKEKQKPKTMKAAKAAFIVFHSLTFNFCALA
jgi:hypothetical protein